MPFGTASRDKFCDPFNNPQVPTNITNEITKLIRGSMMTNLTKAKCKSVIYRIVIML